MLLLGPLITVVVLVLACAFGGRAEREAVVVFALALALSLGLELVNAPHDQLPAAMSDVVLLGGFIFLAVRHRRLWLYTELFVTLVLVVAQVSHDDELDPASAFRTFVNGADLVLLALLMAATVVTRGRVRPRRCQTNGSVRSKGGFRPFFESVLPTKSLVESAAIADRGRLPVK